MIFKFLELNIDVPDELFDSIYPERIRKLSERHWTSVLVAKQAAEFLAEKPGTRVLDIGSGVGKFCMVGAAYTKGHFVGVEQRPDLVEISDRLSDSFNLQNVKFINSNITSIQFRNYDAFYFFNSFHENIALHGQIDNQIRGGLGHYNLYTYYTWEQLSTSRVGTRVVTYYSNTEVIPNTYELIYSLKDDSLKFWEKME